MVAIEVRPFTPSDIAWAEQLLGGFGGRMQARRHELIDVLDGSGLVATLDGEPAGVLTYATTAEGTEIRYVEAVVPNRGVGSRLLAALVELAGLPVWVVTTNDNLDALRFYQRRGFSLRALRAGALEEARKTIKPAIGSVGAYGIPLRDEIELVRNS